MPLKNFYEKLSKKYAAGVEKVSRWLMIISILRLIVFLSAITFIIFYIKSGILIFLILSILFIAFFMFLIILFIRYKHKKEFLSILVEINNAEINALAGNFIYFSDGKEFIDHNHWYTYDLDIFGEDSVYQYINRTGTKIGRKLLAEWMSFPIFNKEMIVDRQDAISELSRKIRWRQHFMATGLLAEGNEFDIENIYRWLNEPVWFSRIKAYNIISYLFPVLTISSIILATVGTINFHFSLLLFISQLIISNFEVRKINHVSETFSKRLGTLKQYSGLLKSIEQESFRSELLMTRKSELFTLSGSANKALGKLSYLLDMLDNRNNIMVGAILNGIFSWNLHILFRLEKWKTEYKAILPQWFSVIAWFDAISGVSNMAFNNPGFVFPVITDTKPVLRVKNIGHPLISSEKRVCNDIAVLNDGDFIIITGPNMAGKSTFLRTIGVNLVFARMGSVVCAEKFEFALKEIYTSMRTTDSLSKNVSYFLAELYRIKNLFDLVNSGKKFFVLLDEILLGTNLKDKQTGSKAILERLITMKMPGIIATHDLTLNELRNKFTDQIFEESFEIEIEEDRIKYDYILRNGITTKMNAMILMKQLGIIG